MHKEPGHEGDNPLDSKAVGQIVWDKVQAQLILPSNLVRPHLASSFWESFSVIQTGSLCSLGSSTGQFLTAIISKVMSLRLCGHGRISLGFVVACDNLHGGLQVHASGYITQASLIAPS